MKPVEILLLISELEGSYQHTKKLGFDEDRDVLRKMCDKYHKLYFKLKKEQKNQSSDQRVDPSTVNRLVAGSNPAGGVTDWNTSVLASPREKRIGNPTHAGERWEPS